MRVKSIHLRNFKRFTDLQIKDLPETAKLVVVVGPNGSGKSSLFDALLQWYRVNVGFGENSDPLYYRKEQQRPYEPVNVVLAEGASPKKGSLYVRSAYRNDPDFKTQTIDRPANPIDKVRLSRLIEDDRTVADNYKRLVYDTTAAVYDASNDAKSVAQLRGELIGNIRTSMSSVFDDLLLTDIVDPLGEGAFYFEKGSTKRFHYKNLSGG